MKICPFVSHMLGEDMDLLVAGGEPGAASKSKSKAKNVVILGYEETEKGAAQASDAGTKKTESRSLPDYVMCLKDACRFYHSKTDDCQFDLIFTMLKSPKPAQAKTAPARKGTDTTAIARDLDKIWQFQTKSVSELVATISDTEKQHKEELESLKKAITKSIEDLKKTQGASGSGSDTVGVSGDIARLVGRIDEREESFENLTTTLSDMVVQMQDSIGQVDSKFDELFTGIGALQKEMPTQEAIQKMIAKSVNDNIGTIDFPDMSEALAETQKEIQKEIEAALKRYQESVPNMDIVVEQTAKAHRETDLKLTKMYNDISEQMASMGRKQQSWQEPLDNVDDQEQQPGSNVAEDPTPPQSKADNGNEKEAKKLNNLGVASFHNDAFETARDQFLESVKLNPEFAEAFNNLGLAYTELQNELDASRAFQRAVDINPNLHEAYSNLGYVLFKQGNYNEAIEMYNEALERSPDNSSVHTNLGNAYFKLEKFSDAEDAWSKALELDPGNDRAKKNLKRIREESK